MTAVATVAVSFTPLPAHVRTARFIVAAVARRAGVAEAILDEVRLAVSEACAVAVRLHRAHAPTAPVQLLMTETPHRFEVQVVNAVPPAPGAGSARATAAGDISITPDRADDADHARAMRDDLGLLEEADAPDVGAYEVYAAGDAAAAAAADVAGPGSPGTSADLDVRQRLGLAVISGLVDDMRVEHSDSGSIVTMTWPLTPRDHPAGVPGAGTRVL